MRHDVPKLIGMLGHMDRNVKLFAVHRLDTLGRKAKEALPSLEEMARASDQEIAKAARKAVHDITVK